MLDPFLAELKKDHLQIEGISDPVKPTLPMPFLSQAIQLIGEFADQYNHFKEEGVLFPMLASKPCCVEAGPIARGPGEHAELLRLLADIVDLVPLERKQDDRAARALRQLYPQDILSLRYHIEEKESMQVKFAPRLLNQETGLVLFALVRPRVGNSLRDVLRAELRCAAPTSRHHVMFDEFSSPAKV